MSYKEKYKDYIGKIFRYKTFKEEDPTDLSPGELIKVTHVCKEDNEYDVLGVCKNEEGLFTYPFYIQELVPITEKKNHLLRWF